MSETYYARLPFIGLTGYGDTPAKAQAKLREMALAWLADRMDADLQTGRVGEVQSEH